MPSAKRVLVVDDDLSTRELVAAALRRRDLTVDQASDGQEALDLLRQNSYAVVVLDLVMPNITGFDVLDAIGTALTRPVVLVTSGADQSTVDKLDPQRIHGIVRKPFDIDDLAGLVVACAEVHGRGGLEAMAISAVIAGGHLLAWLNHFSG